jgi:hypothetical protein
VDLFLRLPLLWAFRTRTRARCAHNLQGTFRGGPYRTEELASRLLDLVRHFAGAPR